jgi:hypothetical protein
MYQINPILDKAFILSRVSEEEIFQRYLITVQLGEKFCNPLREDKNPTCTFYYDFAGRLIFHDFAGYFHGDCFEVVKYIYNEDFKGALLIIAKDFNLLDAASLPDAIKQKRFINREDLAKRKTEIKVKRRDWADHDKTFWKSFHLNSEILGFYKVSPAQTIWINGEVKYQYNPLDPAYIYYFGEGDYKIYFPLRVREYRFLCNTGKLQGYNQLPDKGELLIITKAYKDVMVYRRLGLWAVAPQAEGHCISQETFEDLHARFPLIYSNLDFDRTGLRTSFKMRDLYGIQPLLLTNGRFGTKDYRAKDISDFIRNFGYDATHQLISDVYNELYS